MATNWYEYYQVGSGRSEWKIMVSGQRSEVIGREKPSFITALAVDTNIDDDTPPDVIQKAKYRGDAYFDWDCKSADEFGHCINDVNGFIDDLINRGVNPNCLRYFATGGRGFHIEIPWGVYSTEKADKGVQYLPHIYREMARQLFGRYLDLSIYSGRRGRMWRTCNVQRENGQYKVQISLDEMRRMTPERYVELCSAPRPALEVAAPQLNAELTAMFDTMQSRVTNAKKSAKSKERDKKLLTEYGGVPPTLQKLFDGEGISPTAGLNHFAMQMGIAANELGITDPTEYLERIEGFIKARAKAPGDKHQSESEIAREMLRIFGYVVDNDCYSYSIQAIRQCLEDSNPQSSRDLDGVKPKVNEDGEIIAEEGIDQQALDSLRGGIVVLDNYIARMTEEGLVPLTDFVLDKDETFELCDPRNPHMAGSSILSRCRVRGQKQPLAILEREQLGTVAKFHACANERGGVAPGVNTSRDVQQILTAIQDNLRSAERRAKKYIIATEGMQYIQDPDDPTKMQHFWMSIDGPLSLHLDEFPQYVYKGFVGQEGITGSTVTQAPELSTITGHEKVVDAMLNFNNSDITVANMVGWFGALFIREVMLKVNEQFPLLSLVGEAGSGKTTGALAFLQLFYYRRTSNLQTLQASTVYALNQFTYGSTTVPFALDESKDSSTMKERVQWMNATLHALYTPKAKAQRGGGNATSKSVTAITTQEINSPMLFIGEVINGITAVQERCVIAQFSQAANKGREEYYWTLKRNPDTVAAIGKALILHALSQDPEEVKAVYQEVIDSCMAKLGSDRSVRVVYNIAAVCTGLRFFQSFVQSLYGDKFDCRFEALFDSLLNPASHPNLVVESEASKTLAQLSFMSHQSSSFDYALKHGEDYVLMSEGFVDIHINSVYYKLLKFCKSTGEAPLYSSLSSFAHGMRQCSACVDPMPNSELRTSKATKVFRFSVDALDADGIEAFKQ
ncbi:MAG TPA: hypothetical protein PLQ71_03070 [Nitrospira sp.]|nr:hypothetical protein [Nitrospira sp.]